MADPIVDQWVNKLKNIYVTRRTFIKGAALTTAGAALASCTPKTVPEEFHATLETALKKGTDTLNPSEINHVILYSSVQIQLNLKNGGYSYGSGNVIQETKDTVTILMASDVAYPEAPPVQANVVNGYAGFARGFTTESFSRVGKNTDPLTLLVIHKDVQGKPSWLEKDQIPTIYKGDLLPNGTELYSVSYPIDQIATNETNRVVRIDASDKYTILRMEDDAKDECGVPYPPVYRCAGMSDKGSSGAGAFWRNPQGEYVLAGVILGGNELTQTAVIVPIEPYLDNLLNSKAGVANPASAIKTI